MKTVDRFFLILLTSGVLLALGLLFGFCLHRNALAAQAQHVTVVIKRTDAKQIADHCECCSPEVRGAFKTALGLPSTTTREEDEQSLKDIKSGKADYGDPRQPLKSKPDKPDERPDEP